MGDTAKNVNWNPAESPIWKGQQDNDIGNSTLGQFWKGNYAEAGRGAAGGVGNLSNISKDLGMGLANPIKGVGDLGNALGGQPQAEDRFQEKRRGIDAENSKREQMDRYQSQQNEMNLQRQQADNKRNSDYLQGVETQKKGTADEDAFNRARLAARRAKGNTLFGAYNG